MIQSSVAGAGEDMQLRWSRSKPFSLLCLTGRSKGVNCLRGGFFEMASNGRSAQGNTRPRVLLSKLIAPRWMRIFGLSFFKASTITGVSGTRRCLTIP